ncbi:hypothetical protein HHK36_025907 [Tetracentron sinense]|uniref:Protein kinase domain-containing protein n=1 Tax=Tetracentron sinense TaxID=13715 RepID=A0A834YIA0_TETSI|nr:hypothetical protein HHK36_025907 [Tetracentron sinense]
MRIVDFLNEEHDDDFEDHNMINQSQRRSILSRWLSFLKRSSVASSRSEERRRKSDWKWRKEKKEGESDHQSILLAFSTDRMTSESVVSTGSSGMLGSSGRYSKEVSFNLGVGAGVLFLIAASKNEYNKMMELRRQMELVFNDLKDTSQRNDVINKPNESNDNLSDSTTDLQEVVNIDTYLVIQNHALSYQLVDAETTMECDQSSKCDMARREECLAGMDQLEAELEVELERLQLQLDIEDSPEQLIEMVIENTTPDRSLSINVDEVDDFQEVDSGYHCEFSPNELKRRLHELLEARQEERITELELALECAKRKLLEKEMEVSWWKETVRFVSQHGPEGICSPKPLECEWTRIQVDGATLPSGSALGVGMVALDSEGHLLCDLIKLLFGGSARTAEAEAFRFGMTVAVEKQWKFVRIESDAKEVVEYLNEITRIFHGDIQTILENFLTLRDQCQEVAFHTSSSHSDNWEAHHLAQRALRISIDRSTRGQLEGFVSGFLLFLLSFSSTQMGFGFFGSLLVLTLFFRPLVSQEPNTDGIFVSELLQKMGMFSSEAYNFSTHVCQWQGVLCDTQQENVVGLMASGLGLSGLIPDSTIGKLSKLQYLDLSNNKITSLPSDFWSLGSNLKTLNISFNQISGFLSSNIGNFGVLESLDLSFNNFIGEIPAAISSLWSIKVLKLDRNGFEGSIPSGILNCQSLVSIDLSANRFSGTVPVGFSAAFSKLRSLNLAENQIHGRSWDFTGLKSITYLNISGNLFHGSVMGVFKVPLEVIDLSRNHFRGHISQVYFNSIFNWSSLVFLDLSVNRLTGEFFHSLNQAQNLKHLNLACNRFSKHEFPRIDKLSALEYLNLSQTSLTGQIPSEISQLGSLSTLDLSENHLTGRIPYLGINKLQVLDFSLNNLTGEIPLSLLMKLSQMEKFNFSYNNLTLCASQFSPENFSTSFIGSLNSCPIAANPDLFRRKTTNLKGLELSLAVTVSIVCLLVGLLFLAFGCRKKNRTWAIKQPLYKEEPNISGPFSFQTDSTTWVADVKLATSVPVVLFEKPLLNFTFADLLSATSHFDRGTLLAEGRFGPVYRGFLPGGIHAAVKVLVHGSTMTDQEAEKELQYLGRIKHPNLVPLAGYCLAGDQRIAIYDYMENGNLQNLLHDLPLGIQTTDDWSTDTWEDDNNGIQNVGSEGILTTWSFRHKIALGTARALAFLHHGCYPAIIHRDVKASSVYLDANFETRLSDFGLSKIFGNGLEDDISGGSPGYVPPEVCQPEAGPPTPKSDVYGFGVVLFELLTGKKPVGDDYPEEKESNLVNWVRGLVRKNQGSKAIDPKIQGTGNETQMVEALRIGYLCTADLPSKRPSMQQIVGLLKDIDPVMHQ